MPVRKGKEMIKYLIATVEMRHEFGSLFPTPDIKTYTMELENEPSIKAWEEFIRKKYDMYEETVIAISRLGEDK